MSIDILNIKPQDAIDTIKPQINMVAQSSTMVGTTLNTTSTTYDDVGVTYNAVTQIYADSPAGGINFDVKPQLSIIENL